MKPIVQPARLPIFDNLNEVHAMLSEEQQNMPHRQAVQTPGFK